jgi:hypothetical protein
LEFPVYLHLGFLKLHPHFVFEALAYFIGFRVYLHNRNHDGIPLQKALWVIGVELMKKRIGWSRSTLNLCWMPWSRMKVNRISCILAVGNLPHTLNFLKLGFGENQTDKAFDAEYQRCSYS